jgi:hypothetical protein
LRHAEVDFADAGVVIKMREKLFANTQLEFFLLQIIPYHFWNVYLQK